MVSIRIEKVFKRDESIEVVFVFKKENVRYFSNFKGDESFLFIIREGVKYFLIDFRYIE